MRAGVNAVGIEARDRVGGRAWTTMWQDCALDLGCGWLHSADRNPLVPIAEQMGFAIDRGQPPWEQQSGQQGVSADEQREFRSALDAAYARMEKNPPDQDPPAADFLEKGCRWNPLIDAISCYFSGAELRKISTRDIQAYEDSEVNWRIARGYGAMIAALSHGLPTVGNCPVTAIDHTGPDVRLTTPCGVLRARKVIVTIPTSVLAEGALQFTPALPEKQDAAVHLPLGLANKYTLHCADAEEFPRDGHLFGQVVRVDTGSYHLRPFGRPLIEVYVGGAFAHALEAQGTQAAFAFFTEELTALIGTSFKKRLHLVGSSAWASDIHARGSYSYAQPGHAADRAILARPVNDRLFFAGEACSKNWFSTAHGAYVTGCEAAQAAMASLRGTRHSAAATSNSSDW
jgi:monoamine oxidase